MTPALVSIIIVVYYVVLIGTSIVAPTGVDNNTFFTANRQSPWYLAAFGMTGSFFPISRTICSTPRLCPEPKENQPSLFSNLFTLNLPIKYTV